MITSYAWLVMTSYDVQGVFTHRPTKDEIRKYCRVPVSDLKIERVPFYKRGGGENDAREKKNE